MPVMHRKDGSIVTLSNEDHPALANTLERELEKTRDDLVKGLVNAKDWPHYEKLRGTILGLETAISICIEVKKRLGA